MPRANSVKIMRARKKRIDSEARKLKRKRWDDMIIEARSRRRR